MARCCVRGQSKINHEKRTATMDTRSQLCHPEAHLPSDHRERKTSSRSLAWRSMQTNVFCSPILVSFSLPRLILKPRRKEEGNPDSAKECNLAVHLPRDLFNLLVDTATFQTCCRSGVTSSTSTVCFRPRTMCDATQRSRE